MLPTTTVATATNETIPFSILPIKKTNNDNKQMANVTAPNAINMETEKVIKDTVVEEPSRDSIKIKII